MNQAIGEVAYREEDKAQCNGLELCFDSFGDPSHPPVLMVMGLATQLIHWDEGLCRQLASQGYWVIRFDNRDIGKSTKLEQKGVPSMLAMLANQWFGRRMAPPYLLDDMANDAIALLDNLGIAKAHVVGASMGGMIGQCMAINHPDRLLSLTSIMSTTGDRSLPKPKKSVSLQMAKPLPKEEDAFVTQAMTMWKMLHGDRYPFDAERIEALIRNAKSRCFYPKGVLRQLSAIMGSEDRTTKLAYLTLPCLILHGDADPLVPVECGLATHKAIPGARLKIFGGMGHTLPQELWPHMVEEIVSLMEGSEQPTGL